VAVAFALFDSQLAWAQEQLIHSRTQKIQSKLGIPMHVDHKENATRPITMTRTHNNNCLQSPSPSKTLLRQSKGREIITDRIEGLISQEKSATYVINDYLRNFEANVSEPVDASCRTKMIEWLYICVTALKLRRRVVPIAFSYVDRLLSLKDDSDISKDILQDRSKYQLLIIVCLYIAVKLNEPEVLSPQILSQLCQGRYTEQDIEEEELRVLGALNWRLTGPTALEYVLHFLALDIMPGSRSHVETAAVLNAISRTQAELSVSDNPSCRSLILSWHLLPFAMQWKTLLITHPKNGRRASRSSLLSSTLIRSHMKSTRPWSPSGDLRGIVPLALPFLCCHLTSSATAQRGTKSHELLCRPTLSHTSYR